MQNISIDYNNSILSVSNSVLKYFNGEAEYATLPELDAILNKNYKNVVLMIIDAMGSAILRKNLPQHSFLNSHIIKNISSVFPPTTVAATTTFHSGRPPLHSGWLGWKCYFPQYDKIIEIFQDTEYYSGKHVSESVSSGLIKYDSIYSKITKNNPDVEYCRVFPPFDPNGVDSFDLMCEKIVQSANKNDSRKIISAYWNEPDHSIHLNGTSAPLIKDILKDIEAQIVKMFEGLKDTVVIISADHGALDIEEVYLNNYPDICQTFIRPPALESRFLTFFIEPTQEHLFQELFQKYFGEDFVLLNKEELLSSGILGNGPMNPLVPDFLGNFAAIAVAHKTLRYSTGERAFRICKADHAGFTPDEMTVPLIVLEKP